MVVCAAPMPIEPTSASHALTQLRDSAGLHRIHLLAWRDLDDAEAGGSEIHAAEIAQRWANAGIDVVVRSSRVEGLPRHGRRDGYRVVRSGGRHLVFLDAPLREIFRRDGGRDGLVEVWNGIPFFTPLWARGPRVTFIHHVHEDMWADSVSRRLAPVGRAIETVLAPPIYRRTRILTPSESSRSDIVRRLALPAARITTVPNGVGSAFVPGGARAAVPTVLTVARLVPHKRIELVIEACARLRSTIPDLRLVVVGDGYARPELECLAAHVGGADWIDFTGRIDTDALVEHYRSSWLVASASSAEGWGLTLSEAAATGTSVVATRIPGHLDVVVDGASGLLVEPDDLEAGIRRVLTEPRLRERFERGATERARDLTWDATAIGVLQGLADDAHDRR